MNQIWCYNKTVPNEKEYDIIFFIVKLMIKIPIYRIFVNFYVEKKMSFLREDSIFLIKSVQKTY